MTNIGIKSHFMRPILYVKCDMTLRRHVMFPNISAHETSNRVQLLPGTELMSW